MRVSEAYSRQVDRFPVGALKRYRRPSWGLLEPCPSSPPRIEVVGKYQEIRQNPRALRAHVREESKQPGQPQTGPQRPVG